MWACGSSRGYLFDVCIVDKDRYIIEQDVGVNPAKLACYANTQPFVVSSGLISCQNSNKLVIGDNLK